MKTTMSNIVLQYVHQKIKDYCNERGAWEGPGVNNLVPHDCANAYAMARHLVQKIGFDQYVSVAPEGHIYGYFFNRIGIQPLSVTVDYPPTMIRAINDLSGIAGASVLIIEDDVIGGGTLRIVTSELLKFQPKHLSLFLGHSKTFQHLENVPNEIKRVYIAEDFLPSEYYADRELEFIEEFRKEATHQ